VQDNEAVPSCHPEAPTYNPPLLLRALAPIEGG